MIIALVYSIWAYWWAMTHTRFKWVQNLILLCVFMSIDSLYADTHDLWAARTPVGEFIATFIDVGGYYAFQNALYWAFGFKYWVIGREVPLIIEDTNQEAA